MKESLLRDCKACGKEISRHTPFCRNCGHPQVTPLIIWLLILFLVLMVALYMAFAICGLSVAERAASGTSDLSGLPEWRLS